MSLDIVRLQAQSAPAPLSRPGAWPDLLRRSSMAEPIRKPVPSRVGVNRKHGHAGNRRLGRAPSPTYTSWRAMLHRCRNSANDDWQSYGGRGITVCERWRSFENFLVDMGEKPGGPRGSADAHSIERIDRKSVVSG